MRQGWDAYIGSGGAFVGMTGYGASAPEKTVYEKMGVTAARVVAEAKRQLGK